MARTMTIEEAQANLDELIDEVKLTGTAVIISDERGNQVVMVSASEWASMTKDARLADSPRNARGLFRALARALRLEK